MNIVVLAGGLSTERDVSLSTGSMVCQALKENGHRVFLLDVFMGAPLDGDPLALFTGAEAPAEILRVPAAAPDLDAVRRSRPGDPRSFFGPNVLKICAVADLVFIALHGECGEDGRVQAAFELTGVPYTGTGSLGSVLAMDKDLSKQLLERRGVPTAPWAYIRSADPAPDPAALEARLGLPCVVKPCAGGSSVGVSIPASPAALGQALQAARRFGDVLVEAYVKGREFSVGILGGRALPPVEIIPKEGFYDYENKYQPGRTEEICPARLSRPQTQRMQQLALEAHAALRLGSYSRIDFILGQGGDFVCLEANTLPGMTPTSLLPQEAAAVGIPYAQLCEELVRLAGN